MTGEVSQSPQGNNERTQLTKLDFSLPQCRYESIARFENENGQPVLIRVSGHEKAAVEQYTSELRVDFEVLADEPSQFPEEEGRTSEKETEQPPSQGELTQKEERADQQSIQDLQIVIEAIEAEEIKLPVIRRFSLDPLIGNGVTHEYLFTDKTQADIKIIAHAGKVRAELFQGGKKVDSKVVDKILNSLPPEWTTLTRLVSPGASTNFKLKVTGMMSGSNYSLEKDVASRAG